MQLHVCSPQSQNNLDDINGTSPGLFQLKSEALLLLQKMLYSCFYRLDGGLLSVIDGFGINYLMGAPLIGWM